MKTVLFCAVLFRHSPASALSRLLGEPPGHVMNGAGVTSRSGMARTRRMLSAHLRAEHMSFDIELNNPA